MTTKKPFHITGLPGWILGRLACASFQRDFSALTALSAGAACGTYSLARCKRPVLAITVIGVALLRSALHAQDAWRIRQHCPDTAMLALTQLESSRLQFPTVKDFLEHMRSRQMSCFPDPEQPQVSC